MYNNVSDKYTAHIADSIVRRPKSKIVVGGVTYTGETALMSFPKISHSAERLIGVFPAKTCEFELLNRDGNISLNGREITVYRGLEIDGETEWVPMGIFSATDDNITNELTKRTIKFKGTDRSSRFDTSFVNDIDYPCTILNFVQHICERHGVELETTSFAFANRILLSAPNSDASISDREIIARIAELSGCLAVISRVGGLRIFKPESTGKTVSKWYYKTVSQEPKFGEITAVTLGHSTYTDDIVYPEGATDSAVNWRIDDNPFVDGAIANADGTPAIRADIIADVAQNIIGRSIIPFSVTDFIDDYIYDLGDVITVEKKDGNTFETVILNISSNSRIRSNIGAATQTQSETNFTIAGSTKQQMKKLALEVDYQAGLIRGIVEDADGMRTTIQALSDKIDLKFEDLNDPDHLDIEHVTSISAEGVKVYNGKIQIFKGEKDSTEMIFGTDENGSLGVTGNIKVKFRNASGSKTATLKISNEDFEDDIGEWATASIKVENASGEVFSNISMWEYNGIGTTAITSDVISLSNKPGTISVNVEDTGVSIVGNTSVTGSLNASGDINTNSKLKIKNKLFLDVPTGTTKTRFSIGEGGSETYFWTDNTVFANSGLHTNYHANDIFAGVTHYRKINGTEYQHSFGIGGADGAATGALQLKNGNYINARLDIKEGTYDSDAIDIRGQTSYNGGTYSAWLTLGKTTLKWNGASVSVSSSADKKTNITAASSVLDKVRNAGIYSYNYISEDAENDQVGDIVLNSGTLETTEPSTHYGLVIGDGYNTPEEVISSDGKHIDLYSMIALAWKAIQELATKFDTEVKK